MPELTPTGAVDVVRRQVRRVRRRKNLYELQRASFLTIAAAAAAAAILLPVALLASTDVFTTAVWSTLAVLAGIALVIAGSLRRRWLAHTQTLAWIESRSELDGRVRTLVELVDRPRAAPGFFHPLLAEQAGHGLEGWTPRRLVPRAIPRGALAAALLMAAGLVAALRLAELALPSGPSIAFGDRPPPNAEGGPAERRGAAPGERIVVGPGVPDDRRDRAAAREADAPAEDSTVTQLSSALQESVRRQVWGQAWERVRDALARAETTREAPEGAQGDADENPDAETSDEWEVARAPSGEIVRQRRSRMGKDPSEHTEDQARAEESADTDSTSPSSEDAGKGGVGGAGNGTAPDLFGGPRVELDDDGDSFELSLAARLESAGTGSRPASGPAPEAAPDARPVLAKNQRRESAAHRMTVPASYETVVREVFAHRHERDGRASTLP